MSPERRRSPSSPPVYPMGFIPAKGISRRVPRKNIALLRGRPVICYVIDAARDSGIFDAVYVSTEDPEIAEISRAAGAVVLDRPAHLATDEAPATAAAIDALDQLAKQGKNYDAVSVMYPTAALMLPEDIRGGWKMFQDQRANGCIAVTNFYEHPLHSYYRAGRFIRRTHPGVSGLQTKLREYEVPSGYFYMIRSDLLREKNSYIVPRLAGYRIPRERSVDIDEPEHLKVAEALYGLILQDKGGS